MCEAHEAAGVPCTPSMESIGGAILKAPEVIIGAALGYSALAVVTFVFANAVWFGAGAAVLTVTAIVLLVRKTVRNLKDGRATWNRAAAATVPTRVNGAQRPAVAAPRRPALEAPKATVLPRETAQALAELAGAIIPVQASARAGITAGREAGYRAFDVHHGRQP